MHTIQQKLNFQALYTKIRNNMKNYIKNLLSFFSTSRKEFNQLKEEIDICKSFIEDNIFNFDNKIEDNFKYQLDKINAVQKENERLKDALNVMMDIESSVNNLDTLPENLVFFTIGGGGSRLSRFYSLDDFTPERKAILIQKISEISDNRSYQEITNK